jgi:PTS system ascorbate-specific IIA component
MPDHTDTPKLVDLLGIEMISVNQTASDWKQAADLVGVLLVEAETVSPRYVDAMKEVLQEMGPYAVIAPGIVLLHARPEDGVKEPTFALVTLEEPVNFGNAANDPVDLVFAFGALDKESHVHALRDLADLLTRPGLLDEIRTAESSQAVFEILHEGIQAENSRK